VKKTQMEETIERGRINKEGAAKWKGSVCLKKKRDPEQKEKMPTGKKGEVHRKNRCSGVHGQRRGRAREKTSVGRKETLGGGKEGELIPQVTLRRRPRRSPAWRKNDENLNRE